ELACLVEFVADRGAALIERVEQLAEYAEPSEHGEKDHEGDGDPGFGFHQHGWRPVFSLRMSWSENRSPLFRDMRLPLENRVDRAGGRGLGRRRAGQPGDDRGGGVD